MQFREKEKKDSIGAALKAKKLKKLAGALKNTLALALSLLNEQI